MSAIAREDFAQLVHAEWTKFRTVRGWVIGTVLAGLVIVLFAYLATFAHHDGGLCVGPNPSSGTCQSFSHPGPAIGPGGLPVTDTYYLVHRTLTGDGTITARIDSLTGEAQTGGGGGNGVSVQDLVGAPAAVNEWAKAGLIVAASTRPGAAYAAVMLTGRHGVRMQSDYTGDIAGPDVSALKPRWLRLKRSGTTLTGYASVDGRGWTKVGTARLAGLRGAVQAGLFVTSPPATDLNSPQFFGGEGGANQDATGATATFDRLELHGGWSPAGWSAQDIGANTQLPTLSSVGYQRTDGGLRISGSGDIAPAVAAGYTDEQPLTGVFVGLIFLIVLATMFITAEYRRGLILTTLAATPRRGHVLLAKASVLAAVTFAVGSIACAVSIAIGNHILRVNGNYVYPTSTLTELRVILGTGALLAAVAVLALAVGTALRRSAAAITAVIVLIILPYILATASALPTGPSDWLLRLTPAAGFAIEQTLPEYHQVSYLYDPTGGFYPLAPGLGLAVLCAYALLALLIARRLLLTRDA
ncbi:MAG TPA: ABC transporter permease subunit [Solirubrobacteraceae bacterium]|nr:ABC transporter permease subunit [Solirubrobacteraceae bacterium]